MKVLLRLLRLARRIFGQRHYPEIIPADFEPQHEAPVVSPPPELNIEVRMTINTVDVDQFICWLRDESRKGQLLIHAAGVKEPPNGT